jgi:hypothetical protein
MEQLHQLKQLFHCILGIGSTTILPIQTDNLVSPLKTTSQVNDLSIIGAKSFFKASRTGNTGIAGDYHIRTPLDYDTFHQTQRLINWLILNGYTISCCDCQDADMVRIGFLSRVQPFAWRDDQSKFIKQTSEWKADPFHFKLYHGTFSLNRKGLMTPVLMVDVDRPNIKRGLAVFQALFDGEQPSSPCLIPYLFFTLYQNQLTDEEREQIISDSNQYTGQTSITHIQGFINIDIIVHMKQNVYICLRHLLLSNCSPQAPKTKQFNQVEREADPLSFLFAFHSTDTDTVRQHIPYLSNFIRQCIQEEDYTKIFQYSDYSLTTPTRVINVNKRNRYAFSRTVPEDIQNHTNQAISKTAEVQHKRNLATTAGSRKAVTFIFRNCARTTSCTRSNGTYTFIVNK